MQDHLGKFRPEALMVKEWDHWIVTVRTKQVTPGCLVVLPKRALTTFADVSAEEAVGLMQAIADVERWALSSEFLGADKINVIAAMMKDPIVHFHIIPRFGEEVDRFGQAWVDADWPAVATFRDVTTPEALLQSIRDSVAEQLR